MEAPGVPGVYGFADADRLFGLPLRIEWVYVGKTSDLAARLVGGHDPRREPNAELRAWLLTRGRHAEVWYAVVPGQLDLASVERAMIHALRPRFNHIKYVSSARPVSGLASQQGRKQE